MILPVIGQITAAHADRVRRASAAAPFEEMSVIISSGGGDIAPSFALAEAIKAHRGRTVGRVARRCDSGAILALSACRERRAHSSARFLLHETERDPGDMAGRLTGAALRQHAAELLALDQRCRAFICRNAGIDDGLLALHERSEATLTAREALDLGLLTSIIDRPDLIRPAARRGATTAPPVQRDSRSPWTAAHLLAMAQAGMIGRPLLIAPAALRRILER